ncbi:unnamed protein product [Arabidopsis lyrata]|uniref:Uncharacterized protein n=1 Tax=Arabidopsis lyrata subsp. lyrata TaxID=81972 RepID=D7KK26_ARALL|nr:uncharacterized protein LOC9329237 isoform X1 [Arabidopsis lyrata subsp. lyrata]EFH66704.1 hypothetical protein ARALYDRAFT_889619 [Arabidopsis lyrata subsp. lyrata]CAH8253090.1 unnamed protein product [Arabidopsis lyrata]|eukprot:XP_002890445.1 uncharacterized protein LOC9329237 isoform X1 [Arabidopsis lyrata subsp. lyrata]
MRNMMNSAAAMRAVKEEFIVMDFDDNDEDVRCGKVKEEYMMDAEQINSSTDSGKTNPSNMQQIVSAVASDDDDDDDDDWGTKIDNQYMKLLDSFREDGSSNLSDNPLRSIRYEVDNGGYDKREFKANKRSREDRNTIRVTKKNVEPKPPHVQAGFRLRRRESLVSEKSVEAMLITSHVKRNSKHSFDASEKENLEDLMVLDEGYRSYLTWLVENSKSSRTNPEKERQVKCEEDYTVSLSDSDSDIIVVGDRPFLGEEDSPFVPSKSYKVVDLDEESSDQRNSWFRKEIMNVLKQPYTVTELKELHNEASVHRVSSRHVELRDGTEFSFPTKKKTPSYLDGYPDFKKQYLESLREDDEHKALNLLRGFIFYLTKVVRDDAFKPWLDQECLKIRCF